MRSDGTDSEDQDSPSREGDAAERPYGVKPYGVKPYGVKPYGVKPYGVKPYGVKPYGVKPSAAGRRGAVVLDPEEWSADVAELFCERSAVIRLGATVVSGEYEVRVPLADAVATYGSAGKPRRAAGLALRPRDKELHTSVTLPSVLARDLAARPELAYGLKVDLANALALAADREFLRGTAPGVSGGIRQAALRTPRRGGALTTARQALHAVRVGYLGAFRNPGWILHQNVLDRLSRLLTADGINAAAIPPPPALPTRSLDSRVGLLRLEGAEGGMFLGYPFVTSAADWFAAYFAADWQEAWIGVDEELVTVDISTDADFQGHQTVIRATMRHDLKLRRPQAFAWFRTQ